MARLSISLLGSGQVTLGGTPVTTLETAKTLGLLAYLAVEADRPHPRDKLAGLLWPARPDRAARVSLRHTLYTLRQSIGDRTREPPVLIVTRDSLQFDAASEAWLDVAEFTRLAADAAARDPLSHTAPQASDHDLSHLERAATLYRGPFLEGLSVRGCHAFEEWALFRREQLERQALAVLCLLAGRYERRGLYGEAQTAARRQIEIEPWLEEGHRQLMRALALDGQRGAALAQYEVCRRSLARELGVAPEAETTVLYARLRDGALPLSPEGARTAPVRLTLSDFRAHVTTPLVARERELAYLDRALDAALSGQGHGLFIVGGPGSGKSALAHAFARRAMAAHGDLVAVCGRCNAQSGIGDPYLPFREALQMLTGDIEPRRAGGEITRDHARRLWALLPDTAQALVEVGPSLIGRLLLGPALAARLEAAVGNPGRAPWRARLAALARAHAAPDAPLAAGVAQAALFEQFTSVLQVLARMHPLLLLLDDLQWADAGSIALLFHLGRRLSGSRILILGAYRPGEVALEQGGVWQPLSTVVHELEREWGEPPLDLDAAAGDPATEGRAFVDALLDSEPNRLDEAFRAALARHTGGNALFTVELLRGLQERGGLVRDESGRWVVAHSLNWERIPPRVEAVIAERIAHLQPAWRTALAAASVQGTTFTAEVIANALDVEESEVIRLLSGPLSKQHRLVHPLRLDRLGARRLSHYRFCHDLFQGYLYRQLDRVERARLHETVGAALEALYSEEASEWAVPLAHHFRAAGLPAQAVAYLCRAGEHALHLSGSAEACTHFQDGLALLQDLPPSPARDRQELALQLGLGTALTATHGWAAPERARALARAYELCQGTEDVTTAQRVQTLISLAILSLVQGEYQASLDWGQRLSDLARQTHDSLHLALAHYALGSAFYGLVDLTRARHHLEQASTGYDPRRYRSLGLLSSADVGVTTLTWLTWILQTMGYPDRALRRSQEALALARQVGDAPSLCFALAFARANLHILRREWQTAQVEIENLDRLAARHNLPLYEAWSGFLQGLLKVVQDPAAPQEGLAQMRHCSAAWKAAGTRMGSPLLVILQVEAYGWAGDPTQGLHLLQEGFAAVESAGMRYYGAEMLRLRGWLLLMQEEPAAPATRAEAQSCYLRAIKVAREREARLWELRATIGLCRLRQVEGTPEGIERAHQALAELYDWFSEGLDTPDLQDAKTLLVELSAARGASTAPRTSKAILDISQPI